MLLLKAILIKKIMLLLISNNITRIIFHRNIFRLKSVKNANFLELHNTTEEAWSIIVRSNCLFLFYFNHGFLVDNHVFNTIIICVLMVRS